MKNVYYFYRTVTTYEGERFRHSSLPRGARGNDTFSDTKSYCSIHFPNDMGNGYGYGNHALYIGVPVPDGMDVPMYETPIRNGEYWSHHQHPDSDPRAEEVYLSNKKIEDTLDKRREDLIRANGGTDIEIYSTYVRFVFGGKKIETQLSKIDICLDKPSKFKCILDGMDFLIR